MLSRYGNIATILKTKCRGRVNLGKTESQNAYVLIFPLGIL